MSISIKRRRSGGDGGSDTACRGGVGRIWSQARPRCASGDASRTHEVAMMVACALLSLTGGCSESAKERERTTASMYNYDRESAACPGTKLSLSATGQDASTTRDGIGYVVRGPLNYRPRASHPALIVFSAAGEDARSTEIRTGFTPVATSAGFIVAYVDHRPMSVPNVVMLGGVIDDVAAKFCVDARRVYVAGHSDGGTVATALALLPESRNKVAGIAASAAGFQGEDAEKFDCRPSTKVIVIHNRDDAVFPGWGRQMANWWSRCNRCDTTPALDSAIGCFRYPACESTAWVYYCEGSGGHAAWQERQETIIKLLASAQNRN